MKKFTIRFETESVEEANAIFESCKTGTVINGIKVTAISDGDMFKRLEAVEHQLDIYMEHTTYDLSEEDQETFDELESTINKSWERDIAKA